MSYTKTSQSAKLFDPQQRFRRQVDARVLDSFAPAHIVVDSEGEILYFSSRTGKYLEPQTGSRSRQLLSMARKGLRLELRAALMEAAEKRHAVVRERIEVSLEEHVLFIRLTVEPLIEDDQDPLYLVVFTDLGPPLTPQQAMQHRPISVDSDIASLERQPRHRPQASSEEHETALEELTPGNEELISGNDLQAVNQELASRVDELHRSNADLRNLFESTQIATVFLDKHMLIRNYTPAVTAIFNLAPGDRGRPISDIAHQLEDVDVLADVRQVLDQHKGLERPVRLRNGKIFHLMRVLPYCTSEGAVDGALITFVDVTAVVAAEEQQRVLVCELNHRVRNMLQVVIGLAHQTLHRSPSLEEFERSFMGRMQALGRAYELLSHDGWSSVPLAQLLATQLDPFATEERRYTSVGEPLVVTSTAALSLGLILYELATNATKYGALSSAGGKVDVSWNLADEGNGKREFVLVWQESGGPPVQAPGRSGFGTELVQRQLHYELNGTASMDFEPDGLRVTLAIPAKRVVVESRS